MNLGEEHVPDKAAGLHGALVVPGGPFHIKLFERQALRMKS